ncbi:hypothetical protein ACH46_15585 [Gordonia phthalatica]|uniref:Uncharacterized protein n=1 Tax=Gordonia phthalatica TaxID=1136941 RepID=A0A0N9NB63_9ACTN|nr:hypothetical protein ACH46_15585 [Gordonia phthalatica]
MRDLRRHGDTASEFAVLTADEFLTLVDDTSPSLVQAVTNRQRRYWADRRPTVTLTAALVSAGAPEFAKRVERHLESNA